MKIKKLIITSFVTLVYVCTLSTSVFAHDNLTGYSHDPTRTG